MRIKQAIFVGSMAALATVTALVLAKHSDAQKTSEQSASLPCSAAQQLADGTWTRAAPEGRDGNASPSLLPWFPQILAKIFNNHQGTDE